MSSRRLRLQWHLHARRLQYSRRPILVGPWRSEVGFELLYWIPFLAHFTKHYRIDPARMIAIGRGGSSAWYGMAGTADLYEFLPVDAARQFSIRASQQTGSLKQHTVEGWESHVCALTAKSLGLETYHVLSPSWLYQLVAPWWQGQQPIGWLDRWLLQPVTFPKPVIEPDLQASLPPRYIAMRWYVRATWPHKEDLLLWTRRLVESVASRIPVILIDSPLHNDDHADLNLGEIPNTRRLSEFTHQTPLNNLAIQSAVVARAQGYIGTYGGMAQGAMRWGVPTLALYDQFGQTAPQHLALTQWLSLRTGVPFVACRPKDLEALLPLVIGPAFT